LRCCLPTNTGSGIFQQGFERCDGFAQAAREDFETALELFRLVADDWRESHVPFWVLVGGAAAQEFSLPDLVQE